MLRRSVLATSVGILLLSACAYERGYRKIDKIDPAVHLTPIRPMSVPTDENSDRLLLVLAFSGGGTRAAALAFGVLEALDQVKLQPNPLDPEKVPTLLDQIDSISSVSGGSFPAAYYALHGRKIFSEFPQRMLYRDLTGRIFLRLLYPWNWVKLGSLYYSRSDLAAEVYDDLIFGDASYRNIREHGYANVAIQATDLIEESRFSFTPDFFSRLCLDLMDFPISRAVTASSAFPGPFVPILLKNEAGQCGFQEEPWIQDALHQHDPSTREYQFAKIYRIYENRGSKKYIHLLDGGISDNLGLRGPLESVMTRGGFMSFLKQARLPPKVKVAVIVVNAATSTPKTWRLEYVMPSILQILNTTSTIMINRYNFETVFLLRQTFREWATQWKEAHPDRPYDIQFYISQVSFDGVRDEQEKEALASIPTRLGLPRKDVDLLRSAAKKILYDSPEFQKLVADLGATLPAPLANMEDEQT